MFNIKEIIDTCQFLDLWMLQVLPHSIYLYSETHVKLFFGQGAAPDGPPINFKLSLLCREVLSRKQTAQHLARKLFILLHKWR